MITCKKVGGSRLARKTRVKARFLTNISLTTALNRSSTYYTPCIGPLDSLPVIGTAIQFEIPMKHPYSPRITSTAVG